jgi:hypothetical protein
VNLPVPSLLRRWLTLLLVGLLALGPFLHGHFGASHDTGFHLDGVHAVHAVSPASITAFQTSDEESPALGVATSLPHSEDEDLPHFAFAVLIVALPLLSQLRIALPRPALARPLAGTLYRAGLPPPCLAPPAL